MIRFVMLLLTLGIAVAEDAAVATDPPAAKRTQVALVPWTNLSLLHEDQWLVSTGPELVSVSLSQQPGLIVVIREAGLASERVISGQTGIADASQVVTGAFRRDGDDLEIELRAVSKSGTPPDRSVRTKGPADGYAGMIDSLAARLAALLNGGKAQPPSAPLSAPPLAVAAMLSRARRALAGQRPLEALPDLTRAVRLAPGSGESWNELGTALAAIGLTGAADAAAVRSVATGQDLPNAGSRMLQLAQRLPIAERIPLLERVMREHPYEGRFKLNQYMRQSEEVEWIYDQAAQLLEQARPRSRP